jgi:probable rRNA maturation factor
MLHVLGYDHALPDEERRMFGLQRELLVAFAAEERRRRRS